MKPNITATALAAYGRMRDRELALRRRFRTLLAIGCGIIAVLTVVVPATLISIAARVAESHHFPANELNRNRLHDYTLIDGTLVALTLPLALALRKESRADVAEQLLDSSTESSGGRDNPLAAFALIIIFLGFLYGEFLVIDALKTMWVRAKLRGVDRHRAAVILAKLAVEPVGIDPRTLLLHGENPFHLRQVLAYLVVSEWADVSPRGELLTLVSPAQRAFRGYHVHAGS